MRLEFVALGLRVDVLFLQGEAAGGDVGDPMVDVDDDGGEDGIEG